MANGALVSSSQARIGTIDPSLPESGKPARIRLDYVDGLRALTALYVLLHHEWRQIWPYEFFRYPPALVLRLGGWLNFGHFGVSAFIVISGFCLMLPVVQNQGVLPGTLRQWFLRRAWRILPPYYAALGLSLLLGASLISKPTATIWDACLPVKGTDIVSHLLLLQDIVHPASINYVLWSIATEWHIYFIFPLLLVLWRLAGPRAAAVVVTYVSFGVYLLLYAIHFEAAFPDVVPQYVALFAFGMGAATIVASPPGTRKWLRESIRWEFIAFAALVVVCVFLALFGKRGDAMYVYADYPIGLGVAALLVICGRGEKTPLRAILSFKPLCKIGAFSYSLYLIHAPLLQVMWQYVLHPLHTQDVTRYALLLVAGTPLIVGAAYLFHRLFERPFLHSGRRVVRATAH
ncbi:MAG TPA: acyltransferase [Ktedonobacterales bacterium]